MAGKEIRTDHPEVVMMSGIFVSRAPAGEKRCARCHRPFTPRKEGDRYGPACAKKVTNTRIEIRNTAGEVVAVMT